MSRACSCWQCRRRGGPRAVAPRLALAFDQYRARAPLRRAARQALLSAEYRVAHRELQALRAGAVNDARYVDRRTNKLARAQDELARAKRHLREVERG